MRATEAAKRLRPTRKSYVDHVGKIQTYMFESVTTDATNTEMAICYQYNLLRSDGDKDRALSQAGITEKNFAKLTPELLDIGQKVAVQMEDRGPWLLHSGSGSVTNFYAQGRDVTPKADFVGDNKNYISLKKAGDRALALN